ncbi:carboxypeptidase-like regulatory domain-containing protein [Tunicatimonas pelagia]|uniref:carboxypeptidase-like regulatory domain-containing protein n=1 Tax=Tunicatimonas pelagia TaxID=931531 RepID=UPI002666C0C3|nr:carboxypeptidase-like regulatory domain-containing protein [Tunicatimonas pelagia]WKN45822.1 carboxypeptidase-like regulatory domain-containing protein [Tunicatimonas pelagia]
MSFFTEYLLFSTAAEVLGITILHSLWQGFLLLFLLALFLRLSKSKSSNTRFAVAFATLLLFLAAFGGTFYQQWATLTSPAITELSADVPTEVTAVDTDEFTEPVPEPTTIIESSNDSNWEARLTRLTQLVPWLAWLWVIGSFIFALRLANGLVQSQRLRYRTQPIPADWQQRAKKLAEQLGISQTIVFASTDRSSTPLTLGYLKPIILIPGSLFAMMPTDQLETILIHELAHIKRRDYLWNLIQSVAEVILFYHPAYWYISSVLERERELACDNLTVSVTHRPRTYARALLQVAVQSNQVPLPSVAAARKRGLSDRIQQIIYPGRAQRGISVLPFLLLLSVISLSLAAFSWYQPESDRLSNEQLADSLHQPIYSSQEGYGYMSPEFLQPLNQPDTNSIDYGSTFQEVMDGLSDKFLDTTSLRIDEIYDQVLTIDQSLNQLSRSAMQYGGNTSAESPVNYSSSSVVYLLDGVVVDPKTVKRFSVKSLEVFRAPFHPDLQELVNREYSVVVRLISKQGSFRNAEGDLRPPDYIDYGNLASQLMPLPRHLAYESKGNYLIGHSDFSQKKTDPKTFFQQSTLYLLDGNMVDDPNSIKLNTVRRFEVYYDPLPAPLQNLADRSYSAVVRAFSREYKAADKQQPFVVSGQITTQEEGKVQPVPGIRVEVKKGIEQAITDEVGKFRVPASAEGTLIVHWPDETTSELEINGREFFHLIAQNPQRRIRRYQEIQKRLKQRMDETTLEKDRKAIQQEINTLEKAINSLQQDGQIDTLTRVIRGRVMDAYANQGIEGATIRASDGPTAVTDAKGYYKIHLPIHTTNTVFEFAHSDYDTQEIEVNANIEKSINLSLFGTKQSVASQEKVSSSTSDDPVKIVLDARVQIDSSKAPLYVIDGIPQFGSNVDAFDQSDTNDRLPSLDPDDILTIDVLKDRTATALYGNRGRNGVILITTKRASNLRPLKGQVVEEATGKPLAGVQVATSSKTVVTDEQGQFEAYIPDIKSATLLFEKIGFAAQELVVNSTEPIQITMKPGTSNRMLKLQRDFPQIMPKSLYVVDGEVKSIQEMLKFDQTQVLSVETVKVKDNRVDQFKGLPIEGKDQVVYVTTKDAFMLEEGAEETDSVDLSNFHLLDPTEQPPILVIDGIIYPEEDFPSNLSPKDIKSIKTIKSLEAQKRYGEEAVGGAVLITTKNPTAFKTIEGRIVEVETKKGIAGVKVKADNSSTAETDEEGYYQIQLPATTQKIFLGFTHSDYPKGRIEAEIKDSKIGNIGFIKPENHQKDTPYLLEKTNLEKELFIVDGNIRSDIHSFDDVEALNLDITSTQTFTGYDRWMSIPPEYREQGYTKLVRIVTDDFEQHLVGRTVRGKLVATGSGEPLAGAKISGLRHGKKVLLTRTNERGEYKVTLPEDVATVEYSYPGYNSIVLPDRRLIQSIPMAWTLHLRKEEIPDKAPTFNKQLIVSPNPADDEINVKIMLEEAGSVEFELRDQDGNVLHSVEYHYPDAGRKEVTIPTARFPANAYLLQISVDNFSITRRIILK